MPISNQVKITPAANRPEGGEYPLVTEGIYDAEIMDITYIPAEQTQYGKAQLKLKFKIIGGEYEGVTLSSWVSMTMNAGGFAIEGGTGAPSNLFIITKAVMGKEPDLAADFYPNVLMGGRLKIWVEIRTSQAGKQYSRIVKYSVGTRASAPVAKVAIPRKETEEIPLPEEPEEKEEVYVNEIPF